MPEIGLFFPETDLAFSLVKNPQSDADPPSQKIMFATILPVVLPLFWAGRNATANKVRSIAYSVFSLQALSTLDSHRNSPSGKQSNVHALSISEAGLASQKCVSYKSKM